MKERIIKKQFWMTKEEAAKLKEKAKRIHMTEAALIRALIAGYEPKEKPGREFFDVMNQLSNIGNNMNQIAVKLHTLGIYDADQLDEERRQLRELRSAIMKQFMEPEDRRHIWQ